MHGEVHVVVVVAGRRAVAGGVGPPAQSGEPDLLVPDHVQHGDAVGVGDAPTGQPVAVCLVVTGGPGVDESTGVGGEVARAPLWMLAGAAAAEACGEPVEAGRARLVDRVQGAGCQAAGGCRVLE